MSQDLYFWLKMDKTTRLMVHGTDKQAQVVKTSEFDSLLAENEIPPITVVTRKMGISIDGKRQTVDPWNKNFIAIKPSGVIAEIQPAIEDSELMEEEGVDYLNAGNGIRIAKWRTGESTGQVAAEYTQGSARLLPLITDIGAIVCLQVRGFEENSSLQSGEGKDKLYWTKAEFEGKKGLITG